MLLTEELKINMLQKSYSALIANSTEMWRSAHATLDSKTKICYLPTQDLP